MMKRRFAVILLLVALGTGIGASTAEAVPITGGIGFAGGIEPVADWSTVNAIDITGDLALVVCTGVTPCTGTFGVFNDVDVEFAVYNDFSFNPLGGSVTPLWSVDGFSFNLTSVSSITRASNGVVLEGAGTLLGPAGFDPTAAIWSFSADETSAVFRFSSTTTAASVPDGGSTAMLLWLGVAGLAAARRRFRRH
jgi:hypothetical protein